MGKISIHAPRAGSDAATGAKNWQVNGFQSTLPVRGATRPRERPLTLGKISIHAPRAGSDQNVQAAIAKHGHFNPRSPCGERHVVLSSAVTQKNFNPRSPCGERLFCTSKAESIALFQSTLPVRGATKREELRNRFPRFQSTLPVRGATSLQIRGDSMEPISIHAPRAGSDGNPHRVKECPYDFNPRSPCGERRIAHLGWKCDLLFQSTLPVRGATLWTQCSMILFRFQSTLPVRGATFTVWLSDLLDDLFQSTLPVRGATFLAFHSLTVKNISIHAPRAGSDAERLKLRALAIFQSTLPVRGAT